MKRLAAILLLGIFSFNLFGYRLVASFLETKENQRIETALDASEYSDEQLLSIKQPANLPYYSNTKDFQRIDGEIEIAGIHYKYVKCRIYNDSLELLCIPNAGKMKIQAAKAGFSKMAADFQQPGNNKSKQESGTKSFHKLLSEYEEVYLASYAGKFCVSVFNHSLRNSYFVNNLFLQTAEQPPDFPSLIS